MGSARLVASVLILAACLAAAGAKTSPPKLTTGGVNPATEPAATVAPEVNLRHTVIVDVARQAKDAVVYVSTDKLVATATGQLGIFGQRQYVMAPTTTLGSGFIIHASGYIVTNSHVVDRGQNLRVSTPAGETFDAVVIGQDPQADLAILKIHADRALPTLPLGDSSDLMIGEPVIAIGNPVGLSYSVSAGIVSAVHRTIKTNQKSELDELIQTDAAINPGNSGGPLLNAYGQVIGINTAIRSDAQNIGFAIQVNRLRELIPELMNPRVAAKLEVPLKLEEERSIASPSIVHSSVVLVGADGPKVVESINGHPVADLVDAYAQLLAASPKSPITVVAGGASTTVTPVPIPVPEAIATTQRRFGMTVEPNSVPVAEKYGLAYAEGILVTATVPGSVAATTGIQPGDLIVFLGASRTVNFDQFAVAISQLPKQGQVYIRLVRGNKLMSGAITLG